MLDLRRPRTLSQRVYVLSAAAAVGLALIVVVASALIRHVQAGAACPEWPACYGEPDAAYAAAIAPRLGAARSIHRAAASSILVLTVTTTALAWRRRDSDATEFRFSLASLLVALGLGLLGAVARTSQLPVVVLANLSGGYVVLALILCSLPVRRGAASGGAPRALFLCALALVALQAMLGGLLGAHRLLTTCATHGSCSWAWTDVISGDLWEAWQAPAHSSGGSATGAAFLHAVHRAVGAAVLLAALLCAAARTSSGRALAWLIAGSAALLPALGLLAITMTSPLTIVVAHGAAAAVLAAALARAATEPSPSEVAGASRGRRRLS